MISQAGKFDEAAQALDIAMLIDPRYPPLFDFYRGLIAFARGDDSEAVRKFEAVAKSDPGYAWHRLYLAAALVNLGNLDGGRAEIEVFNKERAALGGVPLFMNEMVGLTGRNLWKLLPQRERLIVGLRKLNLPVDLWDERMKVHRLRGDEIDRLVIGHTLHGRTLEDNKEHGAIISTDGHVQAFGDWTTGSGTAAVKDDRICFAYAATGHEACGEIYRNPGGSRATENEYMWFGEALAYPFSQVK